MGRPTKRIYPFVGYVYSRGGVPISPAPETNLRGKERQFASYHRVKTSGIQFSLGVVLLRLCSESNIREKQREWSLLNPFSGNKSKANTAGMVVWGQERSPSV